MSGKGPEMNELSLEKLRADVEAFLERHQMKAYLLGKQALNDPMFVNVLRQGRDFRLSTVDRVYAWMADYEREEREGPEERKEEDQRESA